MKSIVIVATQNIRVDTHDVVMGDKLAEVRSDHPLSTLTQMISLGQAKIQIVESVDIAPGTMRLLPAGWELNDVIRNADAEPPVVIDLNANPEIVLPTENPASPFPQEAGEGPSEQPTDADPSLVPNRPLFDFPDLDPKLIEYLAAAEPPITTLRQATEYLNANGGHFRKLANIGTAGDEQIKAALGL